MQSLPLSHLQQEMLCLSPVSFQAGHTGPIHSLKFLSDRLLLSAAADDSWCLWAVGTGACEVSCQLLMTVHSFSRLISITHWEGFGGDSGHSGDRSDFLLILYAGSCELLSLSTLEIVHRWLLPPLPSAVLSQATISILSSHVIVVETTSSLLFYQLRRKSTSSASLSESSSEMVKNTTNAAEIGAVSVKIVENLVSISPKDALDSEGSTKAESKMDIIWLGNCQVPEKTCIQTYGEIVAVCIHGEWYYMEMNAPKIEAWSKEPAVHVMFERAAVPWCGSNRNHAEKEETSTPPSFTHGLLCDASTLLAWSEPVGSSISCMERLSPKASKLQQSLGSIFSLSLSPSPSPNPSSSSSVYWQTCTASRLPSQTEQQLSILLVSERGSMLMLEQRGTKWHSIRQWQGPAWDHCPHWTGRLLSLSAETQPLARSRLLCAGGSRTGALHFYLLPVATSMSTAPLPLLSTSSLSMLSQAIAPAMSMDAQHMGAWGSMIAVVDTVPRIQVHQWEVGAGQGWGRGVGIEIPLSTQPLFLTCFDSLIYVLMSNLQLRCYQPLWKGSPTSGATSATASYRLVTAWHCPLPSPTQGSTSQQPILHQWHPTLPLLLLASGRELLIVDCHSLCQKKRRNVHDDAIQSSSSSASASASLGGGGMDLVWWGTLGEGLPTHMGVISHCLWGYPTMTESPRESDHPNENESILWALTSAGVLACWKACWERKKTMKKTVTQTVTQTQIGSKVEPWKRWPCCWREGKSLVLPDSPSLGEGGCKIIWADGQVTQTALPSSPSPFPSPAAGLTPTSTLLPGYSPCPPPVAGLQIMAAAMDRSQPSTPPTAYQHCYLPPAAASAASAVSVLSSPQHLLHSGQTGLQGPTASVWCQATLQQLGWTHRLAPIPPLLLLTPAATLLVTPLLPQDALHLPWMTSTAALVACLDQLALYQSSCASHAILPDTLWHIVSLSQLSQHLGGNKQNLEPVRHYQQQLSILQEGN
jgi:hypothetical protein